VGKVGSFFGSMLQSRKRRDGLAQYRVGIDRQRARQEKRKSAALVWHTLDPDAPVMQLDERFRHCKSDPQAPLFPREWTAGLVKAVEDVRLLGDRDANAVIVDTDDDVARVGARLDRNLSTLQRVLDRVRKQMRQGDGQPFPIGAHA